MADPWVVLAAAGLEGLFGYPARLHARLPHPVVWIGAAIAAAERAWNRPQFSDLARRALGVVAVALIAGCAALAGWLIERVGRRAGLGVVLVILLGALGLAARSLYDHVARVRAALRSGDLPAARAAVGMIVGRDVDALDEEGVAAAALESLAESFNDGVVAPLFWFLLGGLPGLFAFKAVSTADSMIGHMEPRWRAFGWAAARTDDVMNLIPARLAGLLLCLCAGKGVIAMTREAGRHASPNAGWPEAAMAAALGRRLGGPAIYDGRVHQRPVFGIAVAPEAADLGRGLSLYGRACAVLALLLALGGAIWPR